MEYLKEDEILLDEELCAKSIRREDPITKATILFRENIRLVHAIVKRFRTPTDPAISYQDILQIGYEGLWIACTKFDDTRGYAFSTFAVPYIQGRILHNLRSSGNIKRPRYFADIDHHIRALNIDKPIDQEDMKLLISEGFNERQILEYNSFYIASLDSPISNEDNDTALQDIIPDYMSKIGEELSEDELEDSIDIIIDIAGLPDRHRDIVEEYLYAHLEDMKVTTSELATKYGTSQPNVSRIINKFKSTCRLHREEILSIFGYE